MLAHDASLRPGYYGWYRHLVSEAVHSQVCFEASGRANRINHRRPTRCRGTRDPWGARPTRSRSRRRAASSATRRTPCSAPRGGSRAAASSRAGTASAPAFQPGSEVSVRLALAVGVLRCPPVIDVVVAVEHHIHSFVVQQPPQVEVHGGFHLLFGRVSSGSTNRCQGRQSNTGWCWKASVHTASVPARSAATQSYCGVPGPQPGSSRQMSEFSDTTCQAPRSNEQTPRGRAPLRRSSRSTPEHLRSRIRGCRAPGS